MIIPFGDKKITRTLRPTAIRSAGVERASKPARLPLPSVYRDTNMTQDEYRRVCALRRPPRRADQYMLIAWQAVPGVTNVASASPGTRCAGMQPFFGSYLTTAR